MNTTFIYILIDPDTNLVRYVGKSNKPKRRYYKHCSRSDKKTHKVNWINKLLNENKKPILEVIDEVPIEEWVFWESYWVSQFKTWGFNLTNNTNGGNGCTFANKTSFKKGSKPWNKGTKGLMETNSGSFKKGYKQSDEVKKKKSKIMKGRMPSNIDTLLDNGKKSRFKKGYEPWNKGKKGHKLGGKKKAKVVQQIDENNKVIKEFSGCREAADALGVSYTTINKCCRGIVETFRGFKWKYKNE